MAKRTNGLATTATQAGLPLTVPLPSPTGQRVPPTFASLEEENLHLRARLAKAVEVFRARAAKASHLTEAYEEERRKRLKAENDPFAAIYRAGYQELSAQVHDLEDQLKAAGIAPRLNYAFTDRGPDLETVLLELIGLAHPDKWHNAPVATELTKHLTARLQMCRGARRAP